VTVRAVAIGGGFPPCTLYDSVERPADFRWASSDSAVASVGPTGLVTMLQPGEAFISVSTAGVAGSYSARITVSAGTEIP
jgi:uncharacterized protein YjdB